MAATISFLSLQTIVSKHFFMKRIFSVNFLAVSLISTTFIWGGCNGDAGSSKDEKKGSLLDSARATLFQVGDELFSIPSPIQTAILIKNTGANFDKEMLNDPAKAASYSTRVQRSLNLGVYGADLAYITMYDQTQESISFLNASRKIADELGVSSAFDESMLARFQSNLGKKDSLLNLVADAYRSSDNYLKNNEREDVGSLILAGGWIEALFFATKVAQTTENPNVRRRIGEQKNTLENLIKLLQKHNNNEEFAEIVDELINLYSLFEDVEYVYAFEKPTTDESKKTTFINSKSDIKISAEQLEAIHQKISEIRDIIIG